jgi:hypothetical protein
VSKSPRGPARRHLATSPFKPPPERAVETFILSDWVTHDQFGFGSVVAVEEGVAVIVDFGDRRERITSPYAKLTKL